MSRVLKMLMGLIIGIGLMVAGKNTAYASQFFEFNKDTMPGCGYADNLWLIVHSPGEFETSDIIWMIDNDCLDMNGAQWCYSAGLIPKDALSRPALSQEKTKAQTIYDNNDLIDYTKNPPQLLPEYQTASSSVSTASAAAAETAGREPEAIAPEETVREQTSAESEQAEPTKESGEPTYEHYYEDLSTEAKAAYSYFKATGKDCFVQINANAAHKDIEGAYLLSQTSQAGEIRFGTKDGDVLYSFIFRNPAVEKEDVLNLDADLKRVQSGDDTVEKYELSLGSVYPENVSLKILLDRKNQEYTVTDIEGKKIGTYRSDYTGYLEVPVTKEHYTISCDVPVESMAETVSEGVQETQISEETEVNEGSTVEEETAVKSVNYRLIVIVGAVLIATIVGGVVIFRKKK